MKILQRLSFRTGRLFAMFRIRYLHCNRDSFITMRAAPGYSGTVTASLVGRYVQWTAALWHVW